jgi:ribonuclease HII
VGRGCLAGCVVAAAVIVNEDVILEDIKDSKQLSSFKRSIIAESIKKHYYFGIGVSSVKEIEDINILNATKLAMERAVLNLPVTPDLLLIDGNSNINSNIEQITIIKGDQKEISIAAASIIAKVYRDNIMLSLHDQFQQYHWNANKGYGTKKHLEAIANFGITEYHRKNFAPIKYLFNKKET